jgi:hypothetical protein
MRSPHSTSVARRSKISNRGRRHLWSMADRPAQYHLGLIRWLIVRPGNELTRRTRMLRAAYFSRLPSRVSTIIVSGMERAAGVNPRFQARLELAAGEEELGAR